VAPRHERLAHVRPELPARVVFMTGGAFTAEARAFLESVPNRTIEKPFGPGSLRGALAELLRERSGGPLGP
jgi:hypothetical protein